jgi:Rrf2 family protein
VRISAKADYAIRAVCELAAAGGGPVKGDKLASSQSIPPKFLENILSDMRQAGIVRSQRGSEGGYWLARKAEDVTVADIMRAVDGPLATVRGQRPEEVDYTGAAAQLQRVWIAVRHNLREVTETVTVADLAAGHLPDGIRRLADDPEAWVTR